MSGLAGSSFPSFKCYGVTSQERWTCCCPRAQAFFLLFQMQPRHWHFFSSAWKGPLFGRWAPSVPQHPSPPPLPPLPITCCLQDFPQHSSSLLRVNPAEMAAHLLCAPQGPSPSSHTPLRDPFCSQAGHAKRGEGQKAAAGFGTTSCCRAPREDPRPNGTKGQSSTRVESGQCCVRQQERAF